MANRLDALTASTYTKDGQEKTKYTRIGTAWETANGGWSITLEALPVPTMGQRGLETKILLMPPREDQRQSAPAPRMSADKSKRPAPSFDDGDPDDIPF